MKFRYIFNNGGFVFIEAIFLSIILAISAMLIINGFHSAQKAGRETAIRTAAIHLANAQIAELQYLASKNELHAGNYAWLGEADAPRFDNFFGMTIEFDVETTVNNNHAKVIVSWTADNGGSITAERDIFNRQ